MLSKHTLSVHAAFFDVNFEQCGGHLDWLASIMHRCLAYQSLYRINWGSGHSPFVEEEVPRDDGDHRINLKVPKTTWAFHPHHIIEIHFFQKLRTRPFIRREYRQALSDILQAVRTGNENITVGDQDEPESEENLGIGEEEHTDQMSLDTPAGAKRFREEMLDVQADVRERKKQRLQDTGTTFDVDNQVENIDRTDEQAPAEYPNPFQGVESTPKVKGFIITGHPGIGKSIFLYYVLVLRLQASKPTILVTHPDKVTVFLRHGVYSILMTDFEEVIPAIPTTAWCLVDTNESLETVPAPISGTPFFILQAALPKRKHLQWANKTIGILQYVMKPFSLSELIIGYENPISSSTSLSDFDPIRRDRSLDVSETPSEKSLQEYYRQYTPSARFAYQHAGNLDKYTNFVRSLFGQLTVDRMEKLVGAFPLNVDSAGEQILYHILTVTVEAGGQRSVPKIDISSHHLRQLIIEQLQPSYASVGATAPARCCVLGFNLRELLATAVRSG
ncbi:hypothetical protein EV421DRAFT_1926021 [Armillaria borealis]|uniref:Uncharacterized protein n=1 Tax=Armillaria borealis TaxID=47425 RepID=A0AA39MET7_9AGAR|nr:hypothetical protein EV421DRAFT_1926021 [Armillaria borealis]